MKQTLDPVVARTLDLGGPVHYADFGGPVGDGRTRPNIVLVHGLGGSHANWLAVGPALAERARVVAPDLAGFGLTPLAGRSCRVEDNRALLSRFVDALFGTTERVILVGNSMGGLLSLLEATTRPDRIEALILVDPTLPRAPGVPIDREVALVFASYMLPVVGSLWLRRRAATMTPEQSVAETLRVCCVDPSRVPKDVVAAHVEIAKHRRTLPWANDAFLVAARSIVRTLLRHDRFVARLRAVRAPTLLIHGTGDRLVSIGLAHAAARLRPDWTLEVLDGVGHTPQLEDPVRFVAAVERFLDRLR